jgi:hypothetical protein
MTKQIEQLKREGPGFQEDEIKALQKDLETQQIQNKMIEERFTDLQKLTKKLQSSLRTMSAKNKHQRLQKSQQREQ